MGHQSCGFGRPTVLTAVIDLLLPSQESPRNKAALEKRSGQVRGVYPSVLQKTQLIIKPIGTQIKSNAEKTLQKIANDDYFPSDLARQQKPRRIWRSNYGQHLTTELVPVTVGRGNLSDQFNLRCCRTNSTEGWARLLEGVRGHHLRLIRTCNHPKSSLDYMQ